MLRFALGILAILVFISSASAGDPKLKAEDARYLDKLMADFLFDPTGAERVTVEFSSHRVWGNMRAYSRDGWLVRGAGGIGNRVFFTDGDSEPAPQSMTGVDFRAECTRYFAGDPNKETPEEARERKESCVGVKSESDLTLAAWLHKLGHDDLAAKALASARLHALRCVRFGWDFEGPGVRASIPLPSLANHPHGSPRLQLGWAIPDARTLLELDLADDIYRNFLNAFERRQDEAALEYGTKLFRLYGHLVRRTFLERYSEAESVFADLQRRQKAGTAGKDAPRLNPDNLPEDPKKRLAVLIAALEDVTFTPSQHFRGRDTLDDDWRIRAIVRIGEPALPVLIDTFEKDSRRTRSRWHPSVREPLLLAIDAILRMRVLGDFTNAEFRGRSRVGDDKIKVAAAQLRAFWDTYGSFPVEERMMKILTDPKSHGFLCGQAAQHLVWANELGSECWLSGLFKDRLIAKFSKPTVAEAILAVWDRHSSALVHGDEKSYETRGELDRQEYLYLLNRLGDRRIAPALAKRARVEPDVMFRLELAGTALRLGEPEPMNELAKEFETGTLKLREPVRGNNRSGDRDDLVEFIRDLAWADLPSTDRALFALTNPHHRYHQRTRDALLRIASRRGYNSSWCRHPFWLGVARFMLDDTTETGCVYKVVDGRWLMSTMPDGERDMDRLPPALSNQNALRPEATERVCDRMAVMIADAVAGLPPYHFLRLDSEETLRAIKETANKYDRRLRPLNHYEAFRMGWRTNEGFFLPDIKPLAHGATFADVATGDAVFHLDGKGKPADVSLPAWVTLKDESQGLAVQAEIRPDGATVYGVIFRHDMRMVRASEVEKVAPIKKK